MNDWLSFATAKVGLLLPVAVSAMTFVVAVFGQIFKGYTAPNIGYYRRNHGLTTMFLLRNLNAVHYRKSLSVRITAKDGVLESVVVQGGPWTPSQLPAETHKTASGEYLDVTFSEVPSDAVFIIRTHVSGGVVRLDRSPDSALKLRRGALDAPIPVFTLARAVLYFLPRWSIGIGTFFALFVGSVWLGPDRMTVGDWTICALAIVVSVLGFLLVVQYRGKSTIAGFDSGMLGDQLLNESRATALSARWHRGESPRDTSDEDRPQVAQLALSAMRQQTALAGTASTPVPTPEHGAIPPNAD